MTTASVAHVDGKKTGAVVDQQCQREVVGGGRATAASPRTRVGVHWPGHAAMGRRGPDHFSDFFTIFHPPNFKIQNSYISNVQNSPNFA
jgi:hypothetical protein